MAKKTTKKSWGINLDETADAAESAIKKTSHTAPAAKKIAVKKVAAPKKSAGRPKVTTEKIAHVNITVSARAVARKASALEDTTITEYISQLIMEDGRKRKLV